LQGHTTDLFNPALAVIVQIETVSGRLLTAMELSYIRTYINHFHLNSGAIDGIMLPEKAMDFHQFMCWLQLFKIQLHVMNYSSSISNTIQSMDGEASYNLLQWPLSECLSMFILQRLLND
jgi:hypothetical protein